MPTADTGGKHSSYTLSFTVGVSEPDPVRTTLAQITTRKKTPQTPTRSRTRGPSYCGSIFHAHTHACQCSVQNHHNSQETITFILGCVANLLENFKCSQTHPKPLMRLLGNECIIQKHGAWVKDPTYLTQTFHRMQGGLVFSLEQIGVQLERALQN